MLELRDDPVGQDIVFRVRNLCRKNPDFPQSSPDFARVKNMIGYLYALREALKPVEAPSPAGTDPDVGTSRPKVSLFGFSFVFPCLSVRLFYSLSVPYFSEEVPHH
jgi:hypothetical protein